MSATKIDPKQHDETIAAKDFELTKALQQRASKVSTIMSMAGYRPSHVRSYRGYIADSGRRVNLSDALEIFQSMDLDTRNLSHGKTYAEALEDLLDADQVIFDLRDEIATLEEQYTGWSRFFLVTSSSGHIHKSMACSSCYAETQYGWLPELSGSTEEAAVRQAGPTLCTVCFPAAPVEHTMGKKLSKSEAELMAWSPDRAERIARHNKAQQEKEDKKAKKAANALKYAERVAPKINALIDRFGWTPQDGAAFFAAEDEFGYQAVVAYEDICRERTRNHN